MSLPSEHNITLTMSDPQLRQAITEWVQRHTVFTVVRYEGVADKPGTSGFPDFKLTVTVREGIGK